MQVPVKVTQVAGRAGLLLRKAAPDILFGLGISGLIGAAVLAAKAGREHDQLQELNDVHISETTEILSSEVSAQRISETEYKKELGLVYIQSGARWIKLYGPAIGLATASIISLVVGHRQTKQRMASAIAAYTLIERSYAQYRQRVIEKLGQDKDDEFRFGEPETHSYDIVDVDGKKKKQKYRVYRDVSDYVAFFDEFSLYYRSDAPMNMYFLKTQQAHLNDLLQSQGHVFLNEVWDRLGIPRTKAGAVVGWVKNSETGDGIINLGLYSDRNTAFVNGHETACLIDPNVDGVIYDLL